MSALNELLADAQPGYEAQVLTVLRWLLKTLGEEAFEGLAKDDVADRVLERLPAARIDPRVKLLAMSDLASMPWWCGMTLGDGGIARLSDLCRQTIRDLLASSADRTNAPDEDAKSAHVVCVGTLLGPLHSPTRGAIDYVAALASDPNTRRVDVIHAGAISDDLAAFIARRLGDAANIRFHAATGDALVARVRDLVPCTFHIWCEQVHAEHISRVAMLGPTIMFTCGDSAPVQFADVYWYCREPAYIGDLWRRQGAPAPFIDNYAAIESCPFPQEASASRRTRADLGFRDGEVVLVTVGNRLGVEMDQDFVDGVGQLVRGDPNVRWAIVGRLQDYWVEAFAAALGDQFTYIGYDGDLAGLLGLADVFVNPFREGGGTSAIMAIAAGAPVLTRGDRGDVGSFVPAPHRAGSEDEFFGRLRALSADAAMRRQWLEEQQALLRRRVDMALFADELRGLIDLAYTRFAARTPTSLTTVLPTGR